MNSIYEEDFGRDVDYLRNVGFDPYPPRLHIQLPNARERLMAGLRYYLGNNAKWLPGYDDIVDWLTDNKGRGLLCVGTCGLGKTLICQNILPVLIHQYAGKIVSSYTATEMNRNIDKVLQEPCMVIDDLGTETSEVNNYGTRRTPFAELCDIAERRGKLIIITTNLVTEHVIDKKTKQPIPSIEDRYGTRTLDRLRAITKVAIFEGKSMRG